ncbi:MAG: Ig-like domain-containing protein, partial [Acidobacteria bacterium]|nr:Ig-like domain-containing protein [Acidobacteriota bacterium]
FRIILYWKHSLLSGSSCIGQLSGSGEIRRARFAVGGLPGVDDPETGDPFTLPAIDVEAATRRRRVFFAFGGAGLIVGLSQDGATKLAEVIPTMPTTGISVIEDFAPFQSELQIYGGNEQFADVDERLPRPIAVRLLSLDDRPLFRKTVTFESDDDAIISPLSVLTNMFGVAEATVIAPNLASFTVKAGSSLELSATFSLNAGGEGLDGLSKVSGDHQYAVSGEPLAQALVVRAISKREPQRKLELDIEAPPSAVCPATVETNGDGIAIIECTAPTSLGTAPFEIGVTDSSGRSLPEDFQLVVVPTEEQLPQVLFIDSMQPIVGNAGSTIAAGITGRVWAPEGAQVAFVGVTLTTPGDVRFDPPVAIANTVSRFESNVVLGCTPGSGFITASVNAPGDIFKAIPYTTLVGPAASIEKTQGDMQIGASGDILNGPGQGLIAVLKDSCGNPLRSEPVEWEISPPGGVTFVNVFGSTNGSGQMFAVVKLGNSIGPVMLTAKAGGLSTTFTLTVTGAGNQMSIASGDGQLVALGQAGPQPLTVVVKDLEGTPVVGANVDFVVTQGALGLSSASAQTDSQGRASVSVLLGSALGLSTVEARSADLSVVFNLQVVGRSPVVSNIGFVNAASFLVGFVPGSTGSIFGVGLMEGVNGVVGASTFPFPLEIQGVKVFIDGVQCPLISISNVNGTEQINIQVPFEVQAPSDETIVSIDNNGAVANFTGVQTFRVQPGFFEIPENSRLIVAALHLDFTRVTDTNPARPGEVILLFLTGLGPLVEAVGTNVPGNGQRTVENPTVTIDGVEQQVLGGFYAPGLISGYQVNIIIGPGAAIGDLIMQLIAGGVASQQTIIPMGTALP